MFKNLKAQQIINILIINFMIITVGFFFMVAAISSLLSSLRSFIGNNTFYTITEYVLGWPLLILIMYLLIKYVEKKWFSKYEISTHVYMLVPTLEGIILYIILYFQQRDQLDKIYKDGNSFIAFIFIIIFFIILYVINYIASLIKRNKKK